MSDVVIYCEKCGREFNPKVVNIYKSSFNLDGMFLSVVYFKCPYCNKSYIITIYDEKLKQLQKDIEKQSKRWERIVESEDSNEIARKQNVYTSLLAKQRRFKNQSDKLKDKFGDIILNLLDSGI